VRATEEFTVVGAVRRTAREAMIIPLHWVRLGNYRLFLPQYQQLSFVIRTVGQPPHPLAPNSPNPNRTDAARRPCCAQSLRPRYRLPLKPQPASPAPFAKLIGHCLAIEGNERSARLAL
jgi:hypothetical protein